METESEMDVSGVPKSAISRTILDFILSISCRNQCEERAEPHNVPSNVNFAVIQIYKREQKQGCGGSAHRQKSWYLGTGGRRIL